MNELGYEVWQRVATTYTGPGQASWMVWEVGPITGGEHWFDTREEADKFIAQQSEADGV